jgi:tetratricopeptide (TPR) repeat protein
MISRYTFYCAQSFRDSNNFDKAIEWYKKYLDVGLWTQEKYFACLMLGKFYKQRNDFTNTIKYYMKTAEFDVERVEGLVYACEELINNGFETVVKYIYHQNKNYKKEVSGNKLFVVKEMYNNNLEFFYVIAVIKCIIGNKTSLITDSNYKAELRDAYKCFKTIITDPKTTNHKIFEPLLNIIEPFNELIKDDSESLELFYKLQELLIQIKVNQNIYKSLSVLLESNIQNLVKIKPLRLVQTNAKNGIVLVLYSSKFDLLCKTINSIHNTWSDLSKVNYYYCICNNYSKKDKQNVQKLYSHIDFEFIEDQLYLPHMKYKLESLKPKQFIHVTDDYIFHNKLDYVSVGLEGLKQLINKGVKQVCFNKCYAENFDEENV